MIGKSEKTGDIIGEITEPPGRRSERAGFGRFDGKIISHPFQKMVNVIEPFYKAAFHYDIHCDQQDQADPVSGTHADIGGGRKQAAENQNNKQRQQRKESIKSGYTQAFGSESHFSLTSPLAARPLALSRLSHILENKGTVTPNTIISTMTMGI